MWFNIVFSMFVCNSILPLLAGHVAPIAGFLRNKKRRQIFVGPEHVEKVIMILVECRWPSAGPEKMSDTRRGYDTIPFQAPAELKLTQSPGEPVE